MLRICLAALIFIAPPLMASCPTSFMQDQKMSAKIDHYVSSGEYLTEIEEQVLIAKDYLDKRLNTTLNEKLAIVMSVDETAVSNYNAMKQNHYSVNMQAFAASYIHGQPQAIGPVLGLFHYAKRRDVAVFFVSSRPNTPEIINATVKNLKQAGYNGWNELILKPIEDDSMTNLVFKQKARKAIQAQGYEIILNVGDQVSDLEGGISEIAIKLPNPFYNDELSSAYG